MVEYIPILVLLCFAILIAVLIVGASHLLGHRISRKAKLSTYECGMQTIGPTRMKMNIRYYIIAMLFLKRVNDQFEIARLLRTNKLLEE